jgi:hypothetical protein
MTYAPQTTSTTTTTTTTTHTSTTLPVLPLFFLLLFPILNNACNCPAFSLLLHHPPQLSLSLVLPIQTPFRHNSSQLMLMIMLLRAPLLQVQLKHRFLEIIHIKRFYKHFIRPVRDEMIDVGSQSIPRHAVDRPVIP